MTDRLNSSNTSQSTKQIAVSYGPPCLCLINTASHTVQLYTVTTDIRLRGICLLLQCLTSPLLAFIAGAGHAPVVLAPSNSERVVATIATKQKHGELISSNKCGIGQWLKSVSRQVSNSRKRGKFVFNLCYTEMLIEFR